MGTAMARRPKDSIPQHSGSWSATMGAYRFLNNDRVKVEAIGEPVFAQTRQACGGRAVVLCIQDLSELDPVYQISSTRLYQHSVLAVDGGASGEVIGLLNQRWFDDPKTPAKETRAQRRLRWTRSQVWPEAVRAVGRGEQASRWIHVADREADDFQLFGACEQTGGGWVVRVQHNRRLDDGQDDANVRNALYLRQALAQAPVAGGYTVAVQARAATDANCPPRRRRAAQDARLAKVVVSFRQVALPPPRNDPRYAQPMTMFAVWAREVDPPDGVEPVDWLLLSSEPVESLADALRIIQWYRRRWLIEDFHKAQKTGCRLEKSQLNSSLAVQRLAAITAAVAVRLLQMRHAADDPQIAPQPAREHFDPWWVMVVATLAKRTPQNLTVQQFYRTIAQHGGWLGRKHDGRPGFGSLWHGWQRIADHVEGIHLLAQAHPDAIRCV